MSNLHGYPGKPRTVRPRKDDTAREAWFYEQRPGIVLVQRNERCIMSVTIPWSKVIRAVDTHRRVTARKAKR